MTPQMLSMHCMHTPLNQPKRVLEAADDVTAGRDGEAGRDEEAP
jgi:hypothetical protein